MQFRDVGNYTKPQLFPLTNLKNTIFQNKLIICGFKVQYYFNLINNCPLDA